MDDTRYMQLNDVLAYKQAFSLSNRVWELVVHWETFARNTLGSQFARAVDSISANIAEGFGRYGKKDKVKFYRIARGSVYESLDWNEKAHTRKLLTVRVYQEILNALKALPKSINMLIKLTNEKLAD